MLRVGRGKLCKENVLRAHDSLSVDDSRAAKTSLPERQVENMVQAKGDKCTFATPEEESAEIARSLNDTAERENARLNERPHEIHDDAHDNSENHTNNRDKTCAAEERKRGGELHFIITIAKFSRNQTCNDTRENTHLQSCDTEDCSYRAFLNAGVNRAVSVNGAVETQEDVNRCEHNKIKNCRAKDSDTFFLFRHAEGNCQREYQRQVAEDSSADVGKNEHETK